MDPENINEFLPDEKDTILNDTDTDITDPVIEAAEQAAEDADMLIDEMIENSVPEEEVSDQILPYEYTAEQIVAEVNEAAENAEEPAAEAVSASAEGLTTPVQEPVVSDEIHFDSEQPEEKKLELGDVRAVINKIARGKLFVTLAILTTVFTLLQCIDPVMKVLSRQFESAFTSCFYIMFLAFTVLGLWLTVGLAKNNLINKSAFKLSKVYPAFIAIVMQIAAIAILACAVISMSFQTLVTQHMEDITGFLTEHLGDDFQEHIALLLSKNGLIILGILLLILFVFIELIAIRYISLCKFDKRISSMYLNGKAEKNHFGFAVGSSFVFGVIIILAGIFSLIFSDKLSGAVSLLQGVCMFITGLIIKKTKAETEEVYHFDQTRHKYYSDIMST